MYSICVRDHFMIAHSFSGDLFGPAQRLHGATYIVDVELRRPTLDSDGVVVDIGRAAEALRAVLSEMYFRNLDQAAPFTGRDSSTEFLARVVFDRMVAAIRRGELGTSAGEVESLRVTLHESHVAWGAFEARPDEPS